VGRTDVNSKRVDGKPARDAQALLDRAFDRVQDAALDLDRPLREVIQVRVRVDAIKAELAAAAPSAERARAAVDALRVGVPWAHAIIAETILIAWPALATSIAR
jgi:hypothetical protein